MAVGQTEPMAESAGLKGHTILWDNAACAWFMKTLKYEEVLRNEYRDSPEARASMAEFLEKVYNQKRLHSALGYMPPARFEANQKDAAARQLSV